MRTVLIAGASGIVGGAAVSKFVDAGYEVIAVSRRPLEVAPDSPVRHIALDLRDSTACAEAMQNCRKVTHVVYAALYEQTDLVRGWKDPDQMAINLQMIQNLLHPLSKVAGSLEHVTLLQGTKAYGVHLHPIQIPAREFEPRDNHLNFYWLQEDYVRELAAERNFRWTIFRPQIITGAATGVAMNVVPVIGAYAAICEHEGIPFAYPGGPSYLCEATDADLLADAFVWAGSALAAADEHFNITNGDVFEWRSLWPAFAEYFQIEPADELRPLSTWLPEHSAVWTKIARQKCLRIDDLGVLLGKSHQYIDFCFAHGAKSPPPTAILSTIKLRQAGFHEFLDTEASFLKWFKVLRDREVLP